MMPINTALAGFNGAKWAAPDTAGALYGEQGTVIDMMINRSRQHDYGGMYDLLAYDYKHHITRERFIGVCEAVGFEIDQPVLGAMENYGAVSFMPICCLVIRRSGHVDHIDNVLFFCDIQLWVGA